MGRVIASASISLDGFLDVKADNTIGHLVDRLQNEVVDLVIRLPFSATKSFQGRA
jgi:hypothetical protein